MSAIELVAITSGIDPGPRDGGAVTLELLDDLAAQLARALAVSCHVVEDPFPAGFAFDDRRAQYYSTAILNRLGETGAGSTRILGVTSLDLYVPVLTFVFGEAQLGGKSAVVSICRLQEQFYGLPSNLALLRERLVKLALHELGHTFGLPHCENWNCVMASTHAVERLDVKSREYCDACRQALTAARVPPSKSRTGAVASIFS